MDQERWSEGILSASEHQLLASELCSKTLVLKNTSVQKHLFQKHLVIRSIPRTRQRESDSTRFIRHDHDLRHRRADHPSVRLPERFACRIFVPGTLSPLAGSIEPLSRVDCHGGPGCLSVCGCVAPSAPADRQPGMGQRCRLVSPTMHASMWLIL